MIHARDIRFEIGDFRLNASLEVGDSEYFVLLGSTGSGKTLFLESICGLHLTEGRILLDGVDVTDVEPGRRGIGYVPQDGALFYHLDVRHNIGFGLRVRGTGNSTREEAIRRLAKMLQIEKLLDRRIPGLSGGERQRVALARALACEPSVLLLDEPVSALDEFTRDAVCRELVRLQRATGVSVIHVCHSFAEARLVGDRIGVIDQGEMAQVGTPDELEQFPANAYVANLLRLENVFVGSARPGNGGAQIEVDGVTLRGPAADGRVEFVVRPWEIRVDNGTGGATNEVSGQIVEYHLAGPLARVRIDRPIPLVATIAREHAESKDLAEGKTATLLFEPEAIHLLQPRTAPAEAGTAR